MNRLKWKINALSQTFFLSTKYNFSKHTFFLDQKFLNSWWVFKKQFYFAKFIENMETTTCRIVGKKMYAKCQACH